METPTPVAHLAHASAIHHSAVFTAQSTPILEVEQGEHFTLDAHSLLTGGLFEAGEFERCSIPVTGPVRVRGVRRGETLRVDVHAISIANRGAMVTIPGRGGFSVPLRRSGHIVAIADGNVDFGDGVAIPVRPMIGKIGVAPTCGEPSSSSVGAHGGNMDCKDIIAGSAVILPAQVDGALLFVGDLHAAQGDGECSLTGVEVEGTVTLSCSVIHDAATALPVVLSEGRVMTIGDGDDLDEAARASLDAMLALVIADRGWTHERAAMLLSAAADVAVSQLVNARASVKTTLPYRYFSRLPFAPNTAS